MIRSMQWPSTKQLLLLWLLLLGIFSSYARQSFLASPPAQLYDATANILHTSADSCTAQFTANSLNNRYRTVLFNNQSTVTIAVPNAEVIYEWTFGDGIISFDRNPVHSYVANGTYRVCLLQTVRDSITLIEYCTDTICKNIEVKYIEPMCAARYVVDTANSYHGNVVLWNSSAPNSTDTAYSVYQRWQFGDGDSSSLAFPQHSYAEPGLYQVCLTVWSYDSVNNLCSETYCDSVGADAEGRLLYKSSAAAFTINVMDPYRIGLENIEPPSISIYPNPVSNYFTIQTNKEVWSQGYWELTAISGAPVLSGKLGGDKNHYTQVDITNVKEGIYLLTIVVDGKNPVSFYKLSVDR